MAISDVVEVRVPTYVQEVAGQVIHAAGLTVSDVVRIFMTHIAEDRAIPLDIFRPTDATLDAFAEVERGELTRFHSVDALFDDLHADD